MTVSEWAVFLANHGIRNVELVDRGLLFSTPIDVDAIESTHRGLGVLAIALVVAAEPAPLPSRDDWAPGELGEAYGR
jgi:hypothetical protein